MKALSIMQPWSWLIAEGHKNIENRSWPTNFRGRFLIHAGKRHDGPKSEWDWPDIAQPCGFEYGGIVGEAEIIACVRDHPSKWFQGEWGFVITNSKPLPFRPCRGQLGFFIPNFGAP